MKMMYNTIMVYAIHYKNYGGLTAFGMKPCGAGYHTHEYHYKNFRNIQ